MPPRSPPTGLAQPFPRASFAQVLAQFEAIRRWYTVRMLAVAEQGLKSPEAAKAVTAKLGREARKKFPNLAILKQTGKEADAMDRRSSNMFAEAVGQVTGERVAVDSGFVPVKDAPKPTAILLPPDGLPDALAEWTAETTSHITSVRDGVIPALRRDLLRAAQEGMSAEDLAQRWIRQKIPVTHGTVEGRARTIARTQVSQLNARLMQMRAESVGIKRFRWRTVGDSKVRPLHRQINGRLYSFASGHPTEGLPGDPVNCRCHAEAVVNANTLRASPALVTDPRSRAAS